MFLTDGLPTTGEQNAAKIVAAASERNKVHARVFSFGVGYDVNSRLLDQLVAKLPWAKRICAAGRRYRNQSEPALLPHRFAGDDGGQADVRYGGFPKDRGSVINRFYPREIYDLFAGDQLVVVGRYKEGGDVKVKIEGKVADKNEKFDFAGKLTEKSEDETTAYIEKLWAMRRVGEIIEEIDLKGKNDELVEELVKLSTQHGIITPYTSFLADEQANVRDLAENRRAAGRALESLQMEGGYGGFVQRDFKAELQRAAQRLPPLRAWE